MNWIFHQVASESVRKVKVTLKTLAEKYCDACGGRSDRTKIQLG
ncbi:hypothetical protein [uncultured Nostoc sp.]